MIEIAAALLRDSDGRLLLGRRAPHKRSAPGMWDVVGGHIEQGESRDTALVRELREELAIEACDWRWLESWRQPSGEVFHHICVVTAWNGTPVLACDEHTELAWFTPDELVLLPGKTTLDFAGLLACIAGN
jgi:8-oxo-dGTP diphosphatase